MKTLTHYFKSPNEDTTDQGKNTDVPIKIVEDITPIKKRKINLSKSKKRSESTKDEYTSPKTPNNKQEAKNIMDLKSAEKLSGQRNKKRKIEGDSSRPSSLKRIKKTKSLKISSKQRSTKSAINSDESLQATQHENDIIPNNMVMSKIDDSLPVVVENSLSCDEFLVRVKRKRKTKLFEDSDDEPLPAKTESVQSVELVENNESSNATSRYSLFGYFNKVDKETASKQRQSTKIEVKAMVHSSPNGGKIGRKSNEKVNIMSKSKKHKNKLQLDNSDSIEIISSEEISDESSPTNVTAPSEVDQSQNNSLNSNLQSPLIKSQSSNLASIFMGKKFAQQNKAVESILLTKDQKELSQLEIQKGQSEKENLSGTAKEPCKRNNSLKTRKSLKTKKHSGQKHAPDSEKESVALTSQTNGKVVHLVDGTSASNSSLTTQNNDSGKLNSFSNMNDVSVERKLNVESPIAVKYSKSLKNSEGKTPDKPKRFKLKNSNDEITPKKKGLTINGFFAKQNNCLTENIIGSAEKSPRNAKSPWVMKVCLSASKNKKVDSDEDDVKELQDSGEGDSKILSCTREEVCLIESREAGGNDMQTAGEVLVIDDNGYSSVEVSERSYGGRRSLHRNAKNTKPSNEEEEEEEVIDVEEKVIEVKTQITKPTVKMWPFFQKGGARQAKEAPVDEAKMKAKMLFLESGVPESIKRKVEAVKSEAVLGLPAPFPTVSHVLQADKKSSCCLHLGLPPLRSASPPPLVPAWMSKLSLSSSEESEIPVFERPKNVKSFLEKLKEEEPKTEVKVLYKKLKEYRSKAESDIWTEIYKPTNSADMVGNTENIKKLKTWLEVLKNCRKREGSVSSGDEFVSEESEGEDSSFNNMAVISGPCGCGKTSAVYAIAKELDIKVLEINASCNRSGKRILAEFSESTQSHHVERSQPIHGFFNNQGSKKKKRKKSKISEKLKSEKTSLILVEDADLLFADCDEGFVPALASLAASSKRPIVLVTNQANSPHLDRFNNSKLLRIAFNRPRPNKLSLWLRLVGLVEGVMMPPDLALRLVTASNCDVRRCLLQLQLMVTCNNSEVQDKRNMSKLWWGWPSKFQLKYELPTLLEPEEGEPRPETDKKVVMSQLTAVANTTQRLAQLDILSAGDSEECFEEHEDPCPIAWSTRWRDSTALTAPSALKLGLGVEAEWLQQALAKDHDLGLSLRPGQTPQEARWLSILRQSEQLFMPGITTTAHTNHQSVTCDYLPALRELGRSEQVRLANYTRRANRFFNYLQGLGIHASKSYRDFMCDAFS